MDNVRVEAELKHEKQKVEMLQRDLQDSQKVSACDLHVYIFSW